MNYEEVYGELHMQSHRWFKGFSMRPYVDEIAELVQSHDATRLLDYGSGKGYQYLALRVHEAWGGILPHCYDPGLKDFRKKPEGKFAGIICTDVMEHIEKHDVKGVLADIFGYTEDSAFVFFCIACRPSRSKRLPDGRNVHVTIKPPEWWDKQLEPFQRDGLTVRAAYDEG